MDGGTPLYRTNTWTYASGTGNAAVDDLLQVEHVGPGGELIFGYALHPTCTDQVKYLTNAVGVEELDDAAHRRVTTRKSPAGLLSTYTYDGTTKRLLKVVDSISGTPVRTNSYTWLNGFVRTHTDPYGMTRTFDYDLLGRLTTTTYPDSTTEVSAYSLPASTGFNTSGSALPILDPVSFKDRLGNTWWTLPNRVRQVEKIIEPPKVSGGSGTSTFVFGGKFANGRGSGKFTLQPSASGDPKFGLSLNVDIIKAKNVNVGVNGNLLNIGGKDKPACDINLNLNGKC